MHDIPVNEDDFTAFCILYFVFLGFMSFKTLYREINTIT